MSDSSHKTTDHLTIQKWVEARDGRPAMVDGTEQNKSDAGVLRLMFPESKHADDENLTEIPWSDWFEKFDDAKLALIYQEKTADGKPSSFNKLVSR